MAAHFRRTTLSVVLCALIFTVQCASPTNSSFKDKPETNYRYVTPSHTSKSLPCNGNHPCRTLEEYTSDPTYFGSDTIFYFYPGEHRLNVSLQLQDVHHLWLQAVNNTVGVVSISFVKLVTFVWINSTDISFECIRFYITENFTHLFVFKNTFAVNLSNIDITIRHAGKVNTTHIGCSAVLVEDSEVNLVNSSFNGISGLLGSAMTVVRSNVTFSGSTTFMYNQGYCGGAVFLINSSASFTGSNTFFNNTVFDKANAVNETLLCSYSDTTITLVDGGLSAFGGAVASFCSSLTLSGNSNFSKNYAGRWGGIIFITSIENIRPSCSSLTVNGISMFADNHAKEHGGAIVSLSSSLIFKGVVLFVNNSAGLYGGAVAFIESEAVFIAGLAVVSFRYNSGQYGGAMAVLSEGSVLFSSTDDHEIQNCTEFVGNSADMFGGGAIVCDQCTLFFKTSALFAANEAYEGGAISFTAEPPWSFLTLDPGCTLYFIGNYADTNGGALQVESASGCHLSPPCFISLEGAPSSNISLLVFVNNSAGEEGSVVYGGELDRCVVYLTTGNDSNCNTAGSKQVYSKNAAETFLNISSIISQGNTSNISSKTVRLCFCNEKSVPNCSEHELAIQDLYPGQRFNITLVGLGEGNHPAPARIMTQLDDDTRSSTLSPSVQSIDASCTTIYYRFYTSDLQRVDTSYKLYHENPCQSLVGAISIDLWYISGCPPGFTLHNQKCDCDEWVQKFTPNCYIDNISVERVKNNFWISLDDNRTGLVFTQFGCPLDFCKILPSNVSLRDPHSRSLCDLTAAEFCVGLALTL